MSKVSVIIPVYNSEKYIARCAGSLFSQTLEGIEFIFVNDCTPDGSMEVLARSISEFNAGGKVVVVDLESNQGQAVAFQEGLKKASGDYVIKCDSDDEVFPTMYEEMYSLASKNNLDLVICDLKLIYPDGKEYRYPGRLDGMDDIRAMLCNRVPSSICNKLVRREILQKDSFIYPKASMCEDFVFSMQYFTEALRIGYVPKEFYFYYRYPTSYTWTHDLDFLIRKHKQTCENISLAINVLRDKGLYDQYEEDIVHQCLLAKNGLRGIIGEKGVYELWKDTFKEINGKVLTCKSVSFKEKVIFVLIYCHLYQTYKKLKGSR